MYIGIEKLSKWNVDGESQVESENLQISML